MKKNFVKIGIGQEFDYTFKVFFPLTNVSNIEAVYLMGLDEEYIVKDISSLTIKKDPFDSTITLITTHLDSNETTGLVVGRECSVHLRFTFEDETTKNSYKQQLIIYQVINPEQEYINADNIKYGKLSNEIIKDDLIIQGNGIIVDRDENGSFVITNATVPEEIYTKAQLDEFFVKKSDLASGEYDIIDKEDLDALLPDIGD